MSRTQHKFWMIYGMGRGAPTYRHETREAAEQEAQRLAQVSPGTRFVVLAAVASFETDRPEVRRVTVVKPDPQKTGRLVARPPVRLGQRNSVLTGSVTMTKPDLVDRNLPPLEFVHQKGKHDALMTLGFVFVICLMAFLFGLVALL